MIRPFLFPVFLAAVLPLSFCQAQAETPHEDPAWQAGEGMFGREDLLARARDLEQNGRTVKAARLYRRMGQKATHAKARTFALTRAGDCFFKAGKYVAAQDTYKEALAEAAGHIRYGHILQRLRQLVDKFQAGAGRWFGGNLSSAIATLELILETAPLNPGAPGDRLHLGDLYRRNSDYEQATATYRSLIHQYPQKPEAQKARFRLAEMLLKRGRLGDRDGSLHEEAEDLLKHYLAEGESEAPKRQEATKMLAEIHGFQAAQILNKARFYTWESHRRPEAVLRYLAMLEKPPYNTTPAAAQADALRRELADAPTQPVEPSEREKKQDGGKDKNAGLPLKKWLLPINPLK